MWNAKGLSSAAERFNYDYSDAELEELVPRILELANRPRRQRHLQQQHGGSGAEERGEPSKDHGGYGAALMTGESCLHEDRSEPRIAELIMPKESL